MRLKDGILEFADYLYGEVNVRCGVESADGRLESAAEKRTASPCR